MGLEKALPNKITRNQHCRSSGVGAAAAATAGGGRGRRWMLMDDSRFDEAYVLFASRQTLVRLDDDDDDSATTVITVQEQTLN